MPLPSNPARDRFLETQSARLGEPITVFALAGVLKGPPLGAPLVFLLVGATALHLVPAPGSQTVFGIALPGDKALEPPPTRSYPRAQVTFQAVARRGWWALTGPRDQIKVSVTVGTGTTDWKFQLHGSAQDFLADWHKLWSS